MIQSKPDNRGTRVGSTSYAVGPAGAQAWELEGVQDCHGMTVGSMVGGCGTRRDEVKEA